MFKSKVILIPIAIAVLAGLTFLGIGGKAGSYRLLSQFYALVYQDKLEAMAVQQEILEQDGHRAAQDAKQMERLKAAAKQMENDDETAGEELLDDSDVGDIGRVLKPAQ